MPFTRHRILLPALLATGGGALADTPLPVHDWDLRAGAWRGAEIASKAGGLRATQPAEPAFTADGDWDVGATDGIAIEGVRPDQLPTRALSAEAEVAIDAGHRWGGIFCFDQDNGDYERGWLLGHNERSFVFWVSTGGGMLEVTSETAFERGRFYHVVGTFDGESVRLYIDGKLEAERAAKGEIAYPEAAFYSIGVYRDKDEHYPMRGKLRAARLYASALDADGVLARAKSSGVETSLDFAVQPVLRFVSPSSARVSWESVAPGGAAVAFGMSRRLGEVVRSEKSGGEHAVLLEGLEPETTYYYKIGRAAGGEKQFSETYEFSTTQSFLRPPLGAVAVGEQAAREAASALARTGMRKGYALVYGAAERELALELARASELNVVIAEPDPAAVREARQFLYRHGAHGARVVVLEGGGEDEPLPLTNGMVNLLVARQDVAEEVVQSLLVPGRGKAFIIAEDRVIERPRIEGSGSWTHQYGDAGNSSSSGETLGGATATGEFALAWVGRPGADFGIDRNPRMPAPLSAGGRLFHQGMNRIAALDARNGAVLWSLELPDLRRVNVPRDSSNACADERDLYLAIRDRAWVLDGETGERRRTFAVAPGELAKAGHEWGYIARVGPMLIGSSVKPKASYSSFWGKDQWFDGKGGVAGTEKVCSDSLFGYSLDSAGAEPAWVYRKGLILNPTIAALDGRVYFVETRNPALLGAAERRLAGAALWQEQFLVALDARSGKLVWERPIDTEDGAISIYMQAADGRLLIAASNSQFHLYTFEAATGEPIWQRSLAWPDDHHSGHFQHPVITGGKVFLQPNGIDLATGEIMTSNVGRREGCHTYVGAGGALLYRGANRTVSLWDFETETVTSWPRLRPSCWLSTIPAAGMLLMPEAGGGCSCGGWMETSVGFLPKRRLGPVGDQVPDKVNSNPEAENNAAR